MLNPVRAYQDWRWRKRVEWFHVEAEKAREWRDSPWNMKRWKAELVRVKLDGAILIEPYQPGEHEC